MTKEQILALIDAKISGQGTNVDAGSVLPAILNGIIDLIPTVPAPPTPAEIFADLSVKTILTADELIAASGSGLTAAQACQALGISVDDLAKIMAGTVVRFVYGGGSLAMGSQTPASVLIGDASAFSIEITYDSAEGLYDVTAANA